MNIEFCLNNSENNVINKSLTHIADLTCDSNLYAMNIMYPLLHLTDIQSTIDNADYCIIDNVYHYFILDITHAVSGLITIALKLDTLETYKNAILDAYAECLESENVNPDYENANYPVQKSSTIRQFTFDDSGFSKEGSLCLLVVN